MSRTITFVTPENIPVTYEAAGIASRFLATLIDLVIQVLLVAGVYGLASLSGRAGLGAISSVVSVLLFYVIWFGYALLFEALWKGRTPGKKLFGLRVIRDGGHPITFVASAVRNLLRFVDFGIFPLAGTALVLCGLPGMLCIFFSPQYKRFGDYAAGTMVIVEEGSSPLGLRDGSGSPSTEVAYLLPCVRNLHRLTPETYQIVRRFTSRRSSMERSVQAALGERLARPLMEQLEISAPIVVQLQYADLLEAIERRYAEEQGML